jgi:hypothetical protein
MMSPVLLLLLLPPLPPLLLLPLLLPPLLLPPLLLLLLVVVVAAASSTRGNCQAMGPSSCCNSQENVWKLSTSSDRSGCRKPSARQDRQAPHTV